MPFFYIMDQTVWTPTADQGSDGFHYPIFVIGTKWYEDQTPVESILRNNLFLIAHCGFFLINILNVLWILVSYGFVYQQSLWQKTLTKMQFVACSLKMTGCLCVFDPPTVTT
jgi:hypothetical protein